MHFWSIVVIGLRGSGVVAVDGRGISKGVTQVELAYLMAEIGCYNAINFDGGGSTSLNYKGTNNLKYHNLQVVSENDNSARKITVWSDFHNSCKYNF